MLSDRERAEFEQITSQLDDVRLRSPYGSPKMLALCAAVLAGLAVLVTGVATKLTWLGVVGFVVMLAASALLMVRRPTVKVHRSPQSNKESWMSSLEARWNSRREQR